MPRSSQVSTALSLFIVATLLTAIYPSSSTLHALATDYTGFENSEKYQNTPTYERSNQTVHPDLIYFPTGWHGWKYWMVTTPYPKGRNGYENPSILVGNESSTMANGVWQVPRGLNNPIANALSPGFNCDPAILYNNDTSELWIYYCRVRSDLRIANLTLQRSPDGVHWGRSQCLMSWSDLRVSPTIIKQGHRWYLWYRVHDHVEFLSSVDCVSWSSPHNVTFTPKVHPWHLSVKYIPSRNEYWMFYCAGSNLAEPNSQGGYLYFAKSIDRVNWMTREKPMLTTNPSGWDNERIYQSTFVYDPSSNIVNLWYSARNTRGEWHIGYTSGTYSNMAGYLGFKEYDVFLSLSSSMNSKIGAACFVSPNALSLLSQAQGAYSQASTLGYQGLFNDAMDYLYSASDYLDKAQASENAYLSNPITLLWNSWLWCVVFVVSIVIVVALIRALRIMSGTRI